MMYQAMMFLGGNVGMNRIGGRGFEGGMNMFHGHPYFGFFGPYGFLIEWGLVFLFLAVAWVLIQRTKSRKALNGKSDSPALEALKMKLVKGEIDEAEFLMKKEILMK